MDAWDYARTAVDEGKKSQSEADGKPLVGVVIVKDRAVLGVSHRGRTGSGEHAEFGLISELREQGVDLAGSTVYTTLEPCSSRNHPKKPCAEHLIEAGVAEISIGMYDPNPRIHRDGWRLLRDAGMKLVDFPAGLREEVEEDNRTFVDQYRLREGDAGAGVLFDWVQRPDGFRVMTSGGEFVVKFSRASARSLHMYATGVHRVGHARHAHEFTEVDDPTAQDSWQGHSRTIPEDEIGILKGESGSLLVKVVEVHDMDQGAEQNCAKFDFEYRPA